MHFKNLEGKFERESPKKIIFARGGLRLLHIVSRLVDNKLKDYSHIYGLVKILNPSDRALYEQTTGSISSSSLVNR